MLLDPVVKPRDDKATY
ncbi:MAG: hypothetical protein ACEY3D_00850 [Rickettsia sp.]